LAPGPRTAIESTAASLTPAIAGSSTPSPRTRASARRRWPAGSACRHQPTGAGEPAGESRCHPRLSGGHRPCGLGLPVAAWVRVRPGPGQLPKVADLARRSPEVAECHRITGDDCFLLKLHGPSIEGLEALLDSFLMFGQTTTAVVVATPVPPRSPMVGRSD